MYEREEEEDKLFAGDSSESFYDGPDLPTIPEDSVYDEHTALLKSSRNRADMRRQGRSWTTYGRTRHVEYGPHYSRSLSADASTGDRGSIQGGRREHLTERRSRSRAESYLDLHFAGSSVRVL